jgi:hypothetical protein
MATAMQQPMMQPAGAMPEAEDDMAGTREICIEVAADGSLSVYTEGGSEESPKQPAADIGEALQLALDAYKSMSESQPGETAYKAAFSRDTPQKQREAAPGEAAAARRY